MIPAHTDWETDFDLVNAVRWLVNSTLIEQYRARQQAVGLIGGPLADARGTVPVSNVVWPDLAGFWALSIQTFGLPLCDSSRIS